MKYLLDTNAVLYLLGGRLKTPLKSGNYHVSVISEIELLSYSGLSREDDNRIREFLGQVQLVEVTQQVREVAIQLRRQHQLRIPDAIILASAVCVGADVLTNDRRLLQIPGVPASELPLKAGP